MKVDKLVKDNEKGYAIIRCGVCGLEEEFPATAITEPVDVYGDLIDAYYGDDPREKASEGEDAAHENT